MDGLLVIYRAKEKLMKYICNTKVKQIFGYLYETDYPLTGIEYNNE